MRSTAVHGASLWFGELVSGSSALIPTLAVSLVLAAVVFFNSQNVVFHSALARVGAIVLLPIAIALAFAGNVRASDGDLQRGLLESGCVQATIKTLPSLGQTLLYEANCFGSSHKLLNIACAGGRCVVDSPRAPRDEADDD